MCYQLNDVHVATVLQRAVRSLSCSHYDRCLLPSVGYLRIPMEDIQGRSMVEKWYPLSTAVVGRGGSTRSSEHVQLRVRGRYHAVDILPTDMYQSFVQVTSPRLFLVFTGVAFMFLTCFLQYLEQPFLIRFLRVSDSTWRSTTARCSTRSNLPSVSRPSRTLPPV